MDFLVYEAGLNSGMQPVEIKTSTLIFGSGPESDIVIANPYVSRNHFKISSISGRHQISDMNSTNGTWIIRSVTSKKEIVNSDGNILEPNDKIMLPTPHGIDDIYFRLHTEGTLPIPSRDTETESSLVFSSTEPTVQIGDRKITLTQREYEVLRYMDSKRDEWCSRGSLIKIAWPQDKYKIANIERSDDEMLYIPGQPEGLQKLISDIRKKVELDSSQPTLILTLPGHGYKISTN